MIVKQIKVLAECSECSSGNVMRRYTWPIMDFDCQACGTTTTVEIVTVKKEENVIRPESLPNTNVNLRY